jgi:hypothetical protein
MQLDTPPATVGVGAAGASAAAAVGGVLDGVTVVEAVVAVGGSSAPLLVDVCCWGPDPPAGMARMG